MKNLLSGSNASDAREKQDRELSAEKNTSERDNVALEQPAEVQHVRIGDKQYEIVSAPPSDYTPAETWEGLESIGGEEWQREQRDQGEAYLSFVPAKIELDPSQWKVVLRHTLIEALIFSKHGLDICAERREGSAPWEITSAAQVTVADGAVNIRFANQGDEQTLIETFEADAQNRMKPLQSTVEEQEESITQVETSSTPEEQRFEDVSSTPEQAVSDIDALLDSLAARIEPTDEWARVPLTDSALKFAIVKRITQLTGVLISDMAISGSSNAESLYTAALVKPKPKRLIENLPQLEGISNVTIHSKRQTAIDKDKEVGRWKLIEEELVRRNLPVKGTRWQDAKIPSQI